MYSSAGVYRQVPVEYVRLVQYIVVAPRARYCEGTDWA